jgi:uncharacterized protein
VEEVGMEPVTSFPIDRSKAPKLDPWPDFTIVHSGNPKHAGHIAIAEDSGLTAGIWECQPGKFVVNDNFAANYEVAHIIEGKVRITREDGATSVYQAGDTIITPKGFKGVWEVIEPIRKVFALRKA